MAESNSDAYDETPVFIAEGYKRQRHWEVVYHDLVDLYGPMIGPDGIGLWVTYKRFVQHDPDHLLTGLAWPSHRKTLASLLRVSQDSLRSGRQSLVEVGLITATKGRDLVSRSVEAHEEQQQILLAEGKPRTAVRRITMQDLVEAGIQNPANTILIEVHDPLPLYAFCERFSLTYYSEQRPGGCWDVEFEDYPGIVQGPNRILAAIRHITDNLDAPPNDRYYWPLISEEEIRSLLRCKPDDEEIPLIRDRLLARRAQVQMQETRRAVPQPEEGRER
jgi:hypothetical protein